MTDADITMLATILLIVAGSLLALVIGLLLFYLVIREGVREGMRRALRDHELERAERRREEQRRRVSGAVSTSTPPRRPAVAAGASAGAVAAPASAAQAVGSAGSAVAGRPAEPGTLTGGMRLPRRLWGLRSLRARPASHRGRASGGCDCRGPDVSGPIDPGWNVRDAWRRGGSHVIDGLEPARGEGRGRLEPREVCIHCTGDLDGSGLPPVDDRRGGDPAGAAGLVAGRGRTARHAKAPSVTCAHERSGGDRGRRAGLVTQPRMCVVQTTGRPVSHPRHAAQAARCVVQVTDP
jgi:hypothetical protein